MKPTTRKKLAVLLGVLVLLGIIISVLLPSLIDPDQYHDRIVSELERAVGGTVHVGHITWGILKGIGLQVDGFEITGASAFPMDFRLSRIRASVSLFPLLKKKIVLSRLLLESPDVRLRLQSGPQKPTQEQESLPVGAKPAGIALPIEIEQLLVTKGSVSLEGSTTMPGKPITLDIGDIEIQATNLGPGHEMHFDVSMKDNDVPGLGNLKAQGAFVGLTDSLTLQNPRLTVHAMFSSLHVDALKPYLGDAHWVQRLSGSLRPE